MMEDNTLLVIVDNLCEDDDPNVVALAIGVKQAEKIVITLNKNHHGQDVYEKADQGNEPHVWRFGYESLKDQNPAARFWKKDIGLQFMEFLLKDNYGQS